MAAVAPAKRRPKGPYLVTPEVLAVVTEFADSDRVTVTRMVKSAQA